MPTIVTKIIDPDNGSGTHYTSLAAWHAGEQADMVTNNLINVAECRATSGTPDAVDCDFDGWVTSATNYALIQSTGANRHAGVWNPAKYRLQGHLYGFVKYIYVEGIQAETNLDPYILIGFLSGNCTLSCCIVRLVGSNQGVLFDNGDNGSDAFGNTWCFNNLFLTASDSSGQYALQYSSIDNGYVFYMENNTFVNTVGTNVYSQAFYTGSAGVGTTAKNNLASGYVAGQAFNGVLYTGSDYNATSNTDSPNAGTHNRTSQTFTFVNAAGGNYDLATTDAGAYLRGSMLSAVTNGFTTDIVGRVRPSSGPISIGAFEPEATPVGNASNRLGYGFF